MITENKTGSITRLHIALIRLNDGGDNFVFREGERISLYRGNENTDQCRENGIFKLIRTFCDCDESLQVAFSLKQ